MGWGSNQDDGNARFSKGFTGKGPEKKKKKGMTFQERHEARMAKMSPEDKAKRQAKIDAQNSGRYEDGGVAKKKNFFGKLKDRLKKK